MARIKYTKLDRLKATSLEHAKLTGDWDRLRNLVTNMTPGLRVALKAAARKNAKLLIREIKKGIKDQAPGGVKFTPLHQLTIEEKASIRGIGVVGSNTALIRYGDLYNSISYDLDEDGGFQIGFPKNQVGRGGENINMIATVMEYGITIEVTEKMRKYFASQGRPLLASTTHLDVPARPFLEPVLNKHKNEILKNYKYAIERVLYGRSNLTIDSIVGDIDE